MTKRNFISKCFYTNGVFWHARFKLDRQAREWFRGKLGNHNLPSLGSCTFDYIAANALFMNYDADDDGKPERDVMQEQVALKPCTASAVAISTNILDPKIFLQHLQACLLKCLNDEIDTSAVQLNGNLKSFFVISKSIEICLNYNRRNF